MALRGAPPGGGFALLFAAAFPVFAQQPVVEEVVVSARKIQESSQTVPISMSVLTPERLESIQAFDFTDIDRIVPSLQLGAESPAAATLKIRNVGPDFFALAFPPAVAVYVDGAPQAQPGSVFATMLDIERIEVLNGPQGTLYGKNAPAGLISIFTVSPDTAVRSGYVTSSYSSWDTWNNTGAVNLPLVEDRLALRVAGMYAVSDGYMDSAIPGINKSNGKDHKGGRAKLLWTPGEDLEILFGYYYADLRTEDDALGYEGRVPDERGATEYTSDYDQYKVFKGVPTFSDTEVENFTLDLSWTVGEVNLSLVGQYQDLNIFQQQDNSDFRAPPPPEVLRDYLEFNPVAWSLEFRMDGEVTEDVSYVAGAIYSEDDTDTVNFINQINIDGGATTEASGIYTNWTWRFSERWDTSLGARYTDVDYTASVFGFLPEPLGGLDTSFEENYSDPSWSFKLRYYPVDDVLAYLAVDTAFRNGGINVLAPLAGKLGEEIFTADPVSSNLIAIGEDYYEFGPEDSIAYEIGMKGTFLERRLRWNISAFFQTYDDHQYRTSPTDDAVTPTLSGPFSNLAVNVEELEVYGFETELDYLLDESWSVFATAAYAKPEIQEFSKRMCIADEAAAGTLVCPGEQGEPLNDEPHFHMLAQLRFRQRLAGSGLELYARVTAEYYDEPYQAVETPNVDDLLTFDLSVGFREPDQRWYLEAWSRNLTDEVVLFAEEVEENAAGELFGYSASLGAPRSFGVTASYRF